MSQTPRYRLVSVVVPVYNEQHTLRELYERTSRTLSGQPFEFIAVNDGSTDDSLDVLKKLHEEYDNVVIINQISNFGKSLALETGFSMATGDVAVTIDADIQEPPESMPAMFDKLDEGFDLVNGWRAHRKDPFAKRVVSMVFNLLVKLLFKTRLHDINCGFKVFHRDLYSRLRLNGDMHRIIPLLATSMGFTVAEVDVPHVPRRYGKSSYNLLRYRGLLDILAFLGAHTTRWRPFHAFFEISLIFWGLAILSLGGWVTTLLIPENQDKVVRIIGVLLSGVSIWSIFMASLFPIFGLILDILSQWMPSDKNSSYAIRWTLPARNARTEETPRA